jgi:hypothetical protein
MADSRPPPEPPSRIGKFIQTYHSFLSTFVIGAAGLVATSIWQYRQSEIARRTAESQQQIAAAEAENNWRIERAEILSKNLGVLSSSGEGTVEQRYGVLLSLTRGNILDPELTVSYALELGKDNPTYMKSVLTSTMDKSYMRLAGAFEVPCQQRYGTTRDVPACPNEAHVERSLALADLFAEDIDLSKQKHKEGPLVLLHDERSVHAMLFKLTVLFGHYLTDLFERRQWAEVERFEAIAPGAHLVSALVLGPTQPNSFVAASEAGEVDAFHKKRIDWLRSYLYGNSCNGDCKGRIVDAMLTTLAEAKGSYDAPLRDLFARPRGEVAMALARMHSRLLQCQVDYADATELRDRVLVPALVQAVKNRNPEQPTLFEDALSLLALTADPGFGEDPETKAMRTAWDAALTAAREAEPKLYDGAFTARRMSAQVTRKSPPPKLQKSMFCTAEEVSLADIAIEE